MSQNYLYLVSFTAEHWRCPLQFLSIPFQTLQCQKKLFLLFALQSSTAFSLALCFWCAGSEQYLPLMFSASHGRSLSFSPWELLHLAELWVWHGLLLYFIEKFMFSFQWAFAAKGISSLGWLGGFCFAHSCIIAQFINCGKICLVYSVQHLFKLWFLGSLSCIELNLLTSPFVYFTAVYTHFLIHY